MASGGRFDSNGSRLSKKVTFKGTGETSAIGSVAGLGDVGTESLKKPIMTSGFKPGSAYVSQFSSLRKGSGSRDGRKDAAQRGPSSAGMSGTVGTRGGAQKTQNLATDYAKKLNRMNARLDAELQRTSLGANLVKVDAPRPQDLIGKKPSDDSRDADDLDLIPERASNNASRNSKNASKTSGEEKPPREQISYQYTRSKMHVE